MKKHIFQNVGVVVMPRRRQCYVVENLEEVLPKQEAVQAAEARNFYTCKMFKVYFSSLSKVLS